MCPTSKRTILAVHVIVDGLRQQQKLVPREIRRCGSCATAAKRGSGASQKWATAAIRQAFIQPDRETAGHYLSFAQYAIRELFDRDAASFMIIGVADGSIIAIIMRNHMTNALARYGAASDGDAIAALAISMPGIEVPDRDQPA